MPEVVIGSITDQDVESLKTNGKRQFERRRSGKMIHKNISETGLTKQRGWKWFRIISKGGLWYV
jgi:hypothetical protein